MATIQTHEFEERNGKRHIAQRSDGLSRDSNAQLGLQATRSYPSTLLSDLRLNGRGNQPIQTALIRDMQRTYGQTW